MNILEQNANKSPEEFYASLKDKLAEAHDFPGNYLFKFIVPSEQPKLVEIYKAFDGTKHTATNRDSKTGKYTALTIDAFVLDADHVIRLYKEVGKIEGVMML